jgi:hypothetical protein
MPIATGKTHHGMLCSIIVLKSNMLIVFHPPSRPFNGLATIPV